MLEFFCSDIILMPINWQPIFYMALKNPSTRPIMKILFINLIAVELDIDIE